MADMQESYPVFSRKGAENAKLFQVFSVTWNSIVSCLSSHFSPGHRVLIRHWYFGAKRGWSRIQRVIQACLSRFRLVFVSLARQSHPLVRNAGQRLCESE